MRYNTSILGERVNVLGVRSPLIEGLNFSYWYIFIFKLGWEVYSPELYLYSKHNLRVIQKMQLEHN
jgi:hypothetical protein